MVVIADAIAGVANAVNAIVAMRLATVAVSILIGRCLKYTKNI